jgi:hypothetical protein
LSNSLNTRLSPIDLQDFLLAIDEYRAFAQRFARLALRMLGPRAVQPLKELAVDLAAKAMELNRWFYVYSR